MAPLSTNRRTGAYRPVGPTASVGDPPSSPQYNNESYASSLKGQSDSLSLEVSHRRANQRAS